MSQYKSNFDRLRYREETPPNDATQQVLINQIYVRQLIFQISEEVSMSILYMSTTRITKDVS